MKTKSLLKKRWEFLSNKEKTQYLTRSEWNEIIRLSQIRARIRDLIDTAEILAWTENHGGREDYFFIASRLKDKIKALEKDENVFIDFFELMKWVRYGAPSAYLLEKFF